MSITVQNRDTGKPTLAAAVQGTKEAPRQVNTTETPPAQEAATPAQEKKDDFLSPKFAALARQEKQIRTERQRLKDERTAFEAEKQARLNGYIPKDELRKNTLAAMESAGISYDDLTQQILNAPQGQVDPTVRAAQAKIAELESKLDALTKKTEDTQTTAYKQAVDTIRRKVTGIVDSNPEFELIKALDQSEAVVALIEETFKADGYVMTEEEAAREVEEHLAEEAIRMASLEKVKKKLAPPPAEEAPTPQATTPGAQKPLAPQQQQIKTLTNAIAQTSHSGRLTDKQRRENAIAVAQGLPKPH